MNAVLDGLRALGPARLVAMGAVAIGMFALLAVLATHGGNDRMALLYSDLDTREAGQMADALDHAHIPHEANSAGTELLVPSDQVANARLLLARNGLPSGGSIGYEIFDRGDGLTATAFQQQINQTRALEGELARTIRTINGVRAARVHLVLPHREPFERAPQEAQASVLLTLAGANRLDREGVQAVVNLVAAAVPGLRPANIAVIDNRGNLLARAGEPTGQAAAAQTAEEIRHATEARLARAVEQMLERGVGAGHVRAEAAVEMDFDHVQETQEKFDPDGQVVRSTQTVTDNSKTTEAEKGVSVQNNLPNADAGNNSASGTQEQKQDETTNYEIGKTVRTLMREQPQIKRISLAVLVDGVEDKGADGKPAWRERNADELDRMTKLVRGAIGYDEKRGDHVELVSMRFLDDPEGVTAQAGGLFGLPIDRSDLMRLAQNLMWGVLAIAALLFVLRPMVVRLTTLPESAHALAQAGSASAEAVLAAGGDGAALLAAGFGPGGEQARLTGPGGAGAAGGAAASGSARGGAVALLHGGSGDDGALVNLGNIEGQLRASSIRRVAELVDRHPEESLSIVRAWMQQEQNA